jgi:hypothetical protein
VSSSSSPEVVAGQKLIQQTAAANAVRIETSLFTFLTAALTAHTPSMVKFYPMVILSQVSIFGKGKTVFLSDHTVKIYILYKEKYTIC